MATRGKAAEQPVAPKLQLTPAAIERGIARLGERIVELRAFNVASVPNGNSPELTALSADIKDTLERCFGENTSAYKRFQSAAHLQFRPVVFGDNYPQRHHYQDGARENIAQSIVLLESAQRTLQQDLEDARHESAAPSESSVVAPSVLSRRVFVVHGHDGEARETVARFLAKLGFEPVILHEQANQGRTIIEKFEAHGDVGFAVVLLTPDDEGRAKGGELQSRARQNVVLELGYFIGKLGRGKVCALKRGELELPSDYLGVVWEKMDDGGGWRQALGRELQAAGHAIDWNQVMRP
ncbi:TIR domain-containing protein [Burkholderia pseudomallei]|nr:nucleotide-binding protein [Burkholderia pseudomallei]KGS60304.1 putative nucleotide-binding containing TIR-like domain protein [Burkholderia pseudomallei MSHR4868]MBY7655922.1 nucleotide-binding protein [Burkholderia pseudomallei]MDV2130277.1 nucleotide-binding protein [Burkholderia pseudomallei]MDV2232786.1 nucleotide-binding protein [Burkholderia pseudomallei]OMT57663.1 nucleotide-binding protein [Burkholderia pseudomallei]